MKTAILTICTLVFLSQAPYAWPQAMIKPTTDGRVAAMKWLTLVDADAYGTCWNLASRTFRSSVSKAQWVIGMNRARQFYGKVLSRKFKDAAYVANPPGLAAGEYEVLQFQVRLRRQGPAREVVLMAMEKPGVWQVAGYTIVMNNEVWALPLKFLDHR